jgi:hypothetical protein
MQGGGGMAESFSATGAYRTCPVCGKEWFILELQIWGYKRTIRWNSGNTEKLLYFCGWSCMRQFDADPKSYIEAEKNKAAAPKRLSPEATVRAKRRAIRAAAEREGKHCQDCRYYMRDSFGFPFCTFNYTIYTNKAACGRFKQADVFDMEERNEHRKEREPQRVGS